MRLVSLLLLPACLFGSQKVPTDQASVPRYFLESKVVLFASVLRRGPGIEAIVLPHQPATIVMDQDRVRVMNADNTIILYQASIVGEDLASGNLQLQQDAAGVGSVYLAGIGEGRPAEVTSMRFNRGSLVVEVSLWDNDGGRWDFVESLTPTGGGPDVSVTVDPQRFHALTTGQYVTRPDTSSGTMDWYASPESPERTFVDLRIGVEGWNRYFAQFTDFRLNFKGYLPEDVVVGDPHYNVIVVSNDDPGAAYESQGYNPYTGQQSHSLVFVPLGWYYRDVGSTEAGSLPKVPSLLPLSRAQLQTWLKQDKGFPRPTRTVPKVTNRLKNDTLACAFVPRVFAQDDQHGAMLVRAVVMHEIGHALGLGHNFRGSSSVNLAQIGTPEFHFTNSIMDYNIYPFEEHYLFTDGSDGPLLPYDDQIIDAIYNNGSNAMSAPVLPMCTDQQVYNQSGGSVDPTCWPYDFASDPAAAIRIARARLTTTSPRTAEGQLSTIALEAENALSNAKTNSTPIDQFANDLATVLRNVTVDQAFSLSGAMGSSIRTLSEWDLPQNATNTDEITLALGLPPAPNLFKDGRLDPPAYVTYQRAVRVALQTIADDAFSITRDDSDAIARRYFDATDMTWKKTTDPSGSDLLTALAAVKARLKVRAEQIRLMDQAGVDAALTAGNKTLDDTAIGIAAQLAFEVYYGFPDVPSYAPSVLADAAQHYFTSAQAAAADPKADGGARVAALYTMAWIDLTRPFVDGTAVHNARVDEMKAIATNATVELKALSDKRVMDGYFNDDDRDRYGWLNDLVQLVANLTKS